MRTIQSWDEPEFGKNYEFNIIKVNELKEIGVLQVLFKLNEEDNENTLYYVQNYAMDIRKGSEFMNLLGWCEDPGFGSVFAYDTEELVGIFGIGMIIKNDHGESQFKFIETDESHWCAVEGFEFNFD